MSIFSSISVRKPNTSLFDLSHERKLSCDMGQLIPILCQDVVPGDTFQVNSEIFIRFAPMLAPIMHRVNVFTHFFFVPNRLIWKDFQEFITGGVDGNSKPVFPHYQYTNLDGFSLLPELGIGSLADHLGFATFSSTPSIYDFKFSALPFRAYSLIWNEYYRDQNLQSPIDVPLSSGKQTDYRLFSLRNRCWEKDYFTSSLPWPQRGGDVHLPMSGNAPITAEYLPSTGQAWLNPDGSVSADGDIVQGSSKSQVQGSGDVYLDPSIYSADLSEASSASINDLRRSIKLQEWLEKNARGGSRYVEQIFSHFGVKSSDARLQRPEYLGGGKAQVQISEVLQQSQTTEDSALGTMGGRATALGNSNSFRKFFEEHGQIIGIMSVLPRTSYQQGMPRQFQKFDKFDYYFPEFANLGEQEVKSGELFFDGSDNDKSTFGYQQRYAEYKYIPSTVHGDFKSSLDFWHMGRKFSSRPSLNGSFVSSDPTSRIFAVTDTAYPHLWIEIFNNIKAKRPMPYFGVPSF